MKIGNRVTVLPGVSNCLKDASVSFQNPLGRDRSHFVGCKGEVVAIGDNGMALVDDQLTNGERKGRQSMLEWFKVEELEVG